jgi:hypothetical protein
MGVIPLFLGTLFLLLVAGELGLRYGRHRRPRSDEHWRSQATSIQATTLGLLALLLGFTFSISVQRFDTRRGHVVEEANTIGTAYLRVDVLPAEMQPEMRRLLLDYAELRLRAFSDVVGSDGVRALDAASQQIHSQLWESVSAAASRDPHSLPAALMLESTNALIDMHATRLAGRRAHVPGVVILLLGLVAGTSMAFVGFSQGLGSSERSGGVLVLAILFSCALVLILDLDRPSQGLVRVSQEPMRLLLEGMRGSARSTAN